MTDTPTEKLPADKLIDRYVKLRDRIKEADDAHKAKVKPAREMLESLNNQLLELLNATGGDGIKTPNGTAYRTEKKSASLEDAAAFKDFVIANELFDMLDLKANVTAVEDYNKEFGALPPGVKFSSAFIVGVRRASEK